MVPPRVSVVQWAMALGHLEYLKASISRVNSVEIRLRGSSEGSVDNQSPEMLKARFLGVKVHHKVLGEQVARWIIRGSSRIEWRYTKMRSKKSMYSISLRTRFLKSSCRNLKQILLKGGTSWLPVAGMENYRSLTCKLTRISTTPTSVIAPRYSLPMSTMSRGYRLRDRFWVFAFKREANYRNLILGS